MGKQLAGEKGVVMMGIAAKVRSVDPAMHQIRIGYPGGLLKGYDYPKSSAPMYITVYTIGEDKKVTKEGLIGRFVQGDTHAIHRAHNAQEFDKLWERLLKGDGQYYVTWAAAPSVSGSGGKLAVPSDAGLVVTI
jgi:hypothetical protein